MMVSWHCDKTIEKKYIHITINLYIDITLDVVLFFVDSLLWRMIILMYNHVNELLSDRTNIIHIEYTLL